MPQTATNPKTGERVILVNGQWIPIAKTATNPKTGEQVALANNQWVSLSSRIEPVAGGPTLTPRQQEAQRQAVEQRKAERGFFGRTVDWLMGNEPEAPKAYNAADLRARQQQITTQQAQLEAQAKRLDTLAVQASRQPQKPDAPNRAEIYIQQAQTARDKSKALAAELNYITQTGIRIPEAQTTRETIGALPRTFTQTLAGLPGEFENLVGRGLGAVGAPGAEYLKRTGESDIAAAKRLGENIFGAPSEALQFDPTSRFLADVSGGAGSLATFLTPGGAAKLAGVGRALPAAERAVAIARVTKPAEYVLGAGQGLQQGSEDIRQYEQRTGQKVSDPKAFAALVANAGLGLLDTAAARTIFERVPVAQRGAAITAVSDTIRRASRGRVNPTELAQAVTRTLTNLERTAPGRVAVRSGLEGGQESLQQFGTNAAARALYDPDRDLSENVAYSGLLGGIIGGGARGTVELSSRFGARAAANRQRAFEMSDTSGQPLDTFEIGVPTSEDPSQIVRQKVAIVSEPDAKGNVLVAREDGTRYVASLAELQRLKIPTSGLASVPIPDSLSKPSITERLVASLGNAAPDTDTEAYINRVANRLNNSMAQAAPQETETFLEKQRNSLKRARLSEEEKLARMLVLDEAAKVHEDYLSLVTAPPAGVATEPTTPPSQTEPARPWEDILRERAEALSQERQERADILNEVIRNDAVVNKHEAFDNALAAKGLDEAMPVERGVLRDVMRLQSQAETEAGQRKDIQQLQRRVARMDTIERILYDDRIAPEDKLDRINTKLRKQNLPEIEEGQRQDLSLVFGDEGANEVLGPEKKYAPRQEQRTIYGYNEAVAVFGPEGEYTQRRQDIIDAVLADPDITDKYRGFVEALDQQPELGGPESITEGEMAQLRGDAVALEALIPSERGRIPESELRPAARFEERPLAIQETIRAEPDVDTGVDVLGGVEPSTAIAGEPGRAAEVTGEPAEADLGGLERAVPSAPAADVSAAEGEPALREPAATPRAAQEGQPEPSPAQEQPAAATQTINNPEEDVVPAEEKLEDTPGTIENAFPASLNRPRAESIGFAADMERRVKSMSSRVTRAINYKYQNAVDYSRALAASYGLTELPPNLNVAHKFEMLESRKIGGQMRLNRWHLQPIEEKMKKLGLDPQDVGMYLWARSAPARNAMVLEKYGVEDGSGMSNAKAKAVLAELETQGVGPKLREIAVLHDKLVDYMGAQRVQAGLISQKEWRAMRKAQPYYTPLKGYALAGDMMVDGDPDPHSEKERGLAGGTGGSRIREFISPRGRESMPLNPLYNLMSDAQFAIARIERNRVGQAFLENVLSDPKSHEDIVKVYTQKKMQLPNVTLRPKVGRDGLVNMNELAGRAKPELFVVKKDGVSYYLEFQRTPAGNAMYRAFANMVPRDVHKVVRGIQTASNTLKSFKTRYNPIYIGTTAWMRDFNEAILTAYAAKGMKGGPAEGRAIAAKTAKYIASLSGANTIRHYLNGTEPSSSEDQMLTLLFDQFLEDGGAVGHSQIMDAESYAQDAAKDIKRYAALQRNNPIAAALVAKDTLAKSLDHASQLVDLQARFATYRAALEAGIGREGAASLALDSSLNLTRRGEWAPFLDTWSFFFSPTVEGARKLILQGRYGTIARKLFTKTVAMGALLYLFNRFGPGAGDDDEDGRPNILEVNDATAQSRLILRYGPGINQYVPIPVSFGMGYFNYAGGQMMAAMLGDITPEEAGTNVVSGFYNLASPVKTQGTEGLTSIVNFIIPDPAQPLWDLVANRNYFGGTIYTSQGDYRTTPKSELGREGTGEVWKFIARGINGLAGGTSSVESWASMQPEQYRYIVEQLLGGSYGVARDTVNLVTEEPKKEQTLIERLPIIKTLVGRGGEYGPMNKYYDARDHEGLNEIYTTYKHQDDNPDAWEENQAKYPTQANDDVMSAFEDAEKQIHQIRKDYRDGEYASRHDMYDALNEVYEDFNRTYAQYKRSTR